MLNISVLKYSLNCPHTSFVRVIYIIYIFHKCCWLIFNGHVIFFLKVQMFHVVIKAACIVSKQSVKYTLR